MLPWLLTSLLGCRSPAEPPSPALCITEHLPSDERFRGRVDVTPALGETYVLSRVELSRGWAEPAVVDALRESGPATVELDLVGQRQRFLGAFRLPGGGGCEASYTHIVELFEGTITCELQGLTGGRGVFGAVGNEPPSLDARIVGEVVGDQLTIRGPPTGRGMLSYALPEMPNVVELEVTWADGVCPPIVVRPHARLAVTIEPFVSGRLHSVTLCEQTLRFSEPRREVLVPSPDDGVCEGTITVIEGDAVVFGEPISFPISGDAPADVTLSPPAGPLGVLFLSVDIVDGGLRVTRLPPDGATGPEALRVGDVITAISGVPGREGWRLQGGEVGQSARVDVLRDGEPRALTVPYLSTRVEHPPTEPRELGR